MKILILHISDTHLKNDNGVSVANIKEMAKAVRNHSAWDHLLLIYSGDITNSGKSDEYEQAQSLIDRLLAGLFDDLNDARNKKHFSVVCVPGNHDKQHGTGRDNLEKLTKEQLSILDVAERELLDQIWRYGTYEEQLSDQLSHLKEFILFANANDCFKGKELFDQKIIAVNPKNFKIRINLINTAIFTLRSKEDKGLLYISPWCINEINKTDENIDFVVTVMHHDSECFVYGNKEFNLKDSIKEAVYQKSSLVCIGHEHKNHIEEKQKAILQRAGALSKNDNWTSSQFFVGILETEGLKYCLSSFEWNNGAYVRTTRGTSQYTLKNPMREEQYCRPAPRGLCVVNEKCVEDHRVLVADNAIKTYYRMTNDIDIVLKAVCSRATIRNEDLLILVSEQIRSNDLVFILGEGGIGKTTLLVELAGELSKDKTLLPVLQLISTTEESEINAYFDYISDIQKETGKTVVLLVDNPYENFDSTFQLLKQYQDHGIKLIFTERVNRMASFYEESSLLPDETFFSAHAIVLRANSKPNLRIKWLDMNNITEFLLKQEDKITIVSHMLTSITNTKSTADILNEIVQEKFSNKQKNLTVSELFLKACIAYNKQVDSKVFKFPGPRIALCWDEWRRAFSETDTLLEKTPLELCFQYIAALDMFKIKANTNFLSNLTGINNDKLIELFTRKLTENLKEPAELITGEDGKCYVVLKHDSVADMFFEVHNNRSLGSILENAIEHFDDETILRFEKTVFKRRNVQGETPNKYKIDFHILIEKALSSEKFTTILRKSDRLYSLELAHVWSLSSDCKSNKDQQCLIEEWAKLLNKYSVNSDTGNKVWRSCKQDLLKHFLIPSFVTRDDDSIEIVVREFGDQEQLAVMLKENYVTQDDFSRHDLTWLEILTSCLENGIKLPIPIINIHRYVDYKMVTDSLNRFLVFSYNKDINQTLILEETLKIYLAIAEEYPQDIQSRMAIAKIFEKKNNLSEAMKQYKYIYKISPDNYQTLNSMAVLYSLMAKAEFFNSNKISDEYNEEAFKFYKLGIEKSPKEEKAIQHCAFGAYYRNRYMFLNSINEFKSALEIGTNDSSAHNGLAMLYMNAHIKNTYFNCDEALTHFKLALRLATNKNIVSILIPYGNLLYTIGKLNEAAETYKRALVFRKNEPNAKKMLKVIETERQKINVLPQTIFSAIQDIHCFSNCNDSRSDLIENKTDLSYVNWVFNEGKKTQDELKKLENFLENRKNSCDDKYDIISLRIHQLLSFLRQSLSGYQTYCFYIYKYIQGFKV